MTINQAFDLLKNAGDIRTARIITDNIKYLPWWRVYYFAHKLRHGVPVAKLIHKKWFYGLPFYTNKYTLDPRPDTETLVAAVISDNPQRPRILDLGTGTGCIIIALVKNIQNSTGLGIDTSRRALRVAQRNVTNLKLNKKIDLVHQSFANKNLTTEKFDIIVSNPPYIAYGDNRVNASAMHDPKIALYAKNNGLAAYEQIATNAKNWIKKTGKIYLEIGMGQYNAVKKIFISHGWKFVRGESDLGGIKRVLIFTL
ncbi:MAG: peptide chain release factor N(5)-glutamine methyltransferase [Alphaproteobacteria bacterium]|nr:peptide chain release factor N(5)-glutamine methyltransferase [Alphaproteobacteria bacterium]